VTVAGRTRAGEPVSLVDFDGKHFRLTSARAFAPGQPLGLEVGLGSGLSLELKSLGSVRQADGHFEVRARATTLSREVREALIARFSR
jgi:hypothetical protein